MTGTDAQNGDATQATATTHATDIADIVGAAGVDGATDAADVDDLYTLSDTWSATFHMLGDPTRLRLLVLLHYAGPGALSMSELAEQAGVKVPTASAALRLMTTAGIVTATRDGRMMRYALTDERVHRLLHHLGGTHAH